MTQRRKRHSIAAQREAIRKHLEHCDRCMKAALGFGDYRCHPRASLKIRERGAMLHILNESERLSCPDCGSLPWQEFGPFLRCDCPLEAGGIGGGLWGLNDPAEVVAESVTGMPVRQQVEPA